MKIGLGSTGTIGEQNTGTPNGEHIHGYSIKNKNWILFVFDTAWSLATPIIEQFPILGYSFNVLYADEDLGVNCGKLSYNSRAKEWTIVNAEDMKNSRRFAKNIWDKY